MGLENLGEFYKTSGLAPGYVSAVKQGADLNSILANTAQTEAQTQRYTGETPSFLRRSTADARHAELGNLQGEADLQAGVYGAKANESVATARQKALEAQQAWERLPQEHKTKMLSAIKAKSMEMFDTIEQTLSQTSDVGQTISIIEGQYPEVTQDKGWAMARNQVANMPPQQALNTIRAMKAKLASSDFYGSAEGQGRMILEDQAQAGRMDLEKLRGQQGLAEASVRGATTKNTNMAELQKAYLAIYQDETRPMAERQKAKEALEYLAKVGTTVEDSGLGLPAQTTTKGLLPDVGKPKTKTIPREALTELLNNPDTADQFEAAFGVQKGWAKQWLKEQGK